MAAQITSHWQQNKVQTPAMLDPSPFIFKLIHAALLQLNWYPIHRHILCLFWKAPSHSSPKPLVRPHLSWHLFHNFFINNRGHEMLPNAHWKKTLTLSPTFTLPTLPKTCVHLAFLHNRISVSSPYALNLTSTQHSCDLGGYVLWEHMIKDFLLILRNHVKFPRLKTGLRSERIGNN